MKLFTKEKKKKKTYEAFQVGLSLSPSSLPSQALTITPWVRSHARLRSNTFSFRYLTPCIRILAVDEVTKTNDLTNFYPKFLKFYSLLKCESKNHIFRKKIFMR